MSRWRFWAAQIVWFLAAGIAAANATSSNGDGTAVMIALFGGFIMSGFLLKWGSSKQEKQQESRIQSFMIPRVIATGFMWLMYLMGIFISVESIGGWAILLALVLMIPLIAVSALMWSWERISGVKDSRMMGATENQEKRKRERLDNVLRDLSSNDLMSLKQRLMNGSVDDDILYDEMLGDDGELVTMDEILRR